MSQKGIFISVVNCIGNKQKCKNMLSYGLKPRPNEDESSDSFSFGLDLSCALGSLIDSCPLPTNLNMLKFFVRVDESFRSFGPRIITCNLPSCLATFWMQINRSCFVLLLPPSQPRPSFLFLPCRQGERPWMRLVTWHPCDTKHLGACLSISVMREGWQGK